MNTKHTPGPWHVVNDSPPAIRDSNGNNVAPEVCHAPDARLIAAAPDLLAAGERCLMALAANGAPNCEAAKEMRAAIAKATQG